MTLQAVIEDKAQIPAALAEHYVEVDGKFVLDVPGMKTQGDFDNYAEALKKRFSDAGADLARKGGASLSRDDILEVVTGALSKFKPSVEPGNGKAGDGQASGDVAQRLHDLERNVASLTEENKTLTEERNSALNQSKDTTMRNALTEAAMKSGADSAGVANLVTLVQQNFELTQDGSTVTKLDAGNGVSPNMKPADYFANIARDPAFRMYWPPSKGAGADQGDGAGGGAGGDLGAGNPWTKQGWNMTEQGKLYRENKPEAERMM